MTFADFFSKQGLFALFYLNIMNFAERNSKAEMVGARCASFRVLISLKDRCVQGPAHMCIQNPLVYIKKKPSCCEMISPIEIFPPY
jgi:hypothetical protein